jgi:hypothetical protein
MFGEETLRAIPVPNLEVKANGEGLREISRGAPVSFGTSLIK